MTKHLCFACDENNPERIVSTSSDGWIFKFVERFVGPVGRAHGGIAIGALTCPVMQRAQRDGMYNPVPVYVTGRLNLPVPMEEQIRVTVSPEEGRYRVQLHDNSNLILDGRVEVVDRDTEVGSVLQDPPPECLEDLNSLTELAEMEIKGTTMFTRLRQSFEAARIPWPDHKCFGCSESETALKLHHRVARRGDTWSKWETETSFTDGNDRLAATIIAAALDCANQYTAAADDPEFMLRMLSAKKMWMTGTYGVHFFRIPPVRIGGDYRVSARYLGQKGRKLLSMSTLFDSKGTIYAMGEAVAIITNLPDGYFDQMETSE